MSQSSNRSLQFSINETIWLKDGELAEEILSMALEPDITIEENRNYFTIKGGLRLTGEYKPVDEANTSTSNDSDYMSYRTVDDITETDVGTALIDHHFPVDITIPSHRIHEIEDIFVTIESFDYSLPERGCLQLEAEIAITGLVDTKAPPVREKDVSQEDQHQPYDEQMIQDSYGERRDRIQKVEPENEDYGNQQESQRDHDEAAEEMTSIPFQESSYDEANRDLEEEQESNGDPTFEKKEQDRDNSWDDTVNGFNKGIELERQEGVYPYDEEDQMNAKPFQENFHYEAYRDPEEKQESNTGPQIEMKKRNEDNRWDNAKAINENVETDRKEKVKHPYKTVPTPAVPVTAPVADEKEKEQMSSNDVEEIILENEGNDEQEPKKKKPKREENALYLTKMLTHENEQFAKVRMCIVQSGESLESISERYQVPITSILRKNAIDSDELNAGQILYIPVTANR